MGFHYKFADPFFSPRHGGQKSLGLKAPMPEGRYRVLNIRFDIDMQEIQEAGALLLFAGKSPSPGRNPTRNLFSFLVYRRGLMFYRHGPNITGRWKDRPKVDVVRKPLSPGKHKISLLYEQYVRSEVRVLKGTTLLGVGQGAAPLPLRFDGKQELCLAFGFEGKHPNEPPQIGWTWSNLRVSLA